jgi:thiol-disulfide isomerase/thioredoxin
MKKYLSILLFITFFAGFLALQVALDLSDTSARLTPVDKKIKLYYEDLFKSSSFLTLNGKRIRLKELEAPIVILNFWATWCIPCIEEFPSLVALSKRFNNKQVFIVGVNTDNTDIRRVISKAIKRHKLNFPIVSDSNGHISKEYMVSSLPFALIYKQGEVLDIWNGKKDYSDPELIEQFIAAQK